MWGMDWIELAQDRGQVACTCEALVPYSAGNFLTR